MAILCYLGILFLIPLATNAHKTSPFVKFHLNQGVVFVLGSIAFGVVWGILIAIAIALMLVSYALGLILSAILYIALLAPFILMILGIVNAATGKFKELPVIGKFNIIK